jgi:hypothetical protein
VQKLAAPAYTMLPGFVVRENVKSENSSSDEQSKKKRKTPGKPKPSVTPARPLTKLSHLVSSSDSDDSD